MTNARAWSMRALYILIAAAFAIGLFITAAPAQTVNAADDEVKAEWSTVATPTLDGWVLAPESTLDDFAYASEGDVAYVVAQAYDEDWANGGYYLLKSDNGAATWTDLTSGLEDMIDLDDGDYIEALLRVETDGSDPDFVAVAVYWWDNTDTNYHLNVFFSTDGGDTFIDAGEVEDGGLTFNYIMPNYGFTDLAVSPEVDGKRYIAAGGVASDGDAGLFRCLITGDSPGAWEDATEDAGWDDEGDFTSFGVTFMEFSPNYATDRTILVTTVVPDGMPPFDVYLQSGSWGLTPGWNAASTLGIDAVLVMNDVYIIGTPATEYDPRVIAGLTLPSDYNSKNSDTRILWVWVNYEDPANSFAPASQIVRVDNDDTNPVVQQVKNGELWLSNVSYYGTIAEGKAIAGILGTGTDVITECEPVQVYRNGSIANMDICCEHWQKACKPPTGMTGMGVAYVSADKAYAVALHGLFDYDEGAWSVSFDDGNTWNQLSLVDTYINYFSDVAVSPDCNKMWVVSVNLDNGCMLDSVWLKATDLPEAPEYSGYWIRVWNGAFEVDTGFEKSEQGFIRLPADETAGDTVFLVNYGTNYVWVNDLEGLGCWTPIASTALDEIVDLAAPTADMLYALDFNGDVSMYDDEGWHDAVASEVDNGWTIAVHGDYILVGSAWDGQVSYSDDAGETFTLLDETVPLEYQECSDCTTYDADNGHTSVAFDTYFDTNDVIYAAIEGWYGGYSAGGIYDWVLGTSTDWTDLGAEHDYAYTGIVLSYLGGNPFTSADTGGVLYASFKYMDYSYARTGVARSLTPIVEEEACATCPTEWDYLYEGLPDRNTQFEATPFALKACGCMTSDTNTELFAVETRHDYNMIDGTYAGDYYYADGRDFVDDVGGAVWTFEDCYAKKAVEVSSPADGFVVATSSCDCCNVPFTILWDRLCDACCYDIEFALDADFEQIVPVYFDDMIDGPLAQEVDGGAFFYCPESGTNPSAFVPCNFQPETTYYWRVRAAEAGTGQIIHSWWSDARSFTVAPTAAAGAIDLVAPIAGATDVGIKNVGFSWHMLATWDSFDFVLSPNADLSAPLSTKTGLHGTATTYSAGQLTYATTYYWQVTAYKDGSAISTSPIGTFTTTPHGAFCSAIDGACFDTEAALEAHNSDLAGQTAPTPFWVWVVIGIGAVLVIVVIVLIFRTRRV
jgi:hypothetical protein